MKRILLAAAAVAVSVGTFALPASAGSICVSTDVHVNGTALPTNGESCVAPP